ncbi:MAG: hypothetical protein KJ587_07150 [Alphaproteobacteria bacterium]|nr:hypothetical protein [Alphaproteobacteria bacterium]
MANDGGGTGKSDGRILSNAQQILFDTSLPLLVDAVVELLGSDEAQQGVFLRDSTGRLAFICASETASDELRKQYAMTLRDRLASYARADRPIAFKGDPGVDEILSDPARLPVRVGSFDCQLIDRRIVGTGWLGSPKSQSTRPPRVVFSSIKGGVGRSSALVIAAADLARNNKNVLVVDLDLEAPGLGDLLLSPDRMPKLGVIDFLVENGIGGVPDSLLNDFIGISTLTSASGGRVDVIPALGGQSSENAANVLPKLARAMVEDFTEDGGLVPVSEQIATMISSFIAKNSYDIVLIDSRAGLAEISAPSIISLGATVLLFGTTQLQTVRGYRALLATLGQLARRDRARGFNADWRLSLKAVVAKTTLQEETLAAHRDALYDVFAEELYDEDSNSLDDINFNIDDREAPHWPLVIPFNSAFIQFDPLRDPSHLTSAFYEQTFQPFLSGLYALLNLDDLSDNSTVA